MNAGSWVARRRPVSVDSARGRYASGPRFERFAAAMQAAPPPEAQVLPDSAEAMPRAAPSRPAPAPASSPLHLRPAEPIEPEPQPFPPPEAFDETTAAAPDPGPTVVPRRPVVENVGRRRTDVPWLGIGSWLLLCGALFASLVGWPDQTALDRVTSLWSDAVPSATMARNPVQEPPTPAESGQLPADQQEWSAMTPPPAREQDTLPPIEMAPPIQSEAPAEPAIARPPLPRFKPNVDGVAAKFSNAFLEFGDRLQQQGDLDAAVHMRRQSTNLSPWKSAGASDL